MLVLNSNALFKKNLQDNHIYPTALKNRLDERTFQATSNFSYILHI
jgi:hypothetical protein